MAANVIVFDASTDSEDECPATKTVTQKTKLVPETHYNSTTDSDSERSSIPVVRKTRKTVRGCNRNASRQPLDDMSNDVIPPMHIYTKPVITDLFNIKRFPTDDDLEDVEEEEMVIKLSKKSSKCVSLRRSVPHRQTRSTTESTVYVINSDDDIQDVTVNNGHVEASDCGGDVRERSPTPPPSREKASRQLRRRSRTPKETTKAVGNLESLRGRLRMQRQFDEASDDVLIIDDPLDASPVGSKLLTIKVRSMHGVQRIPMKAREPFEGVIEKMAETEGVSAEQIVLYFGDHHIQRYDTPQLLKLTVADILDCHIIRHNADDSGGDGEEEEEDADFDDPSMVRLRVRGQEKRTAILTIRLKLTDPLEKLMREYAMKCGLTLAKLRFSFDGDAVRRTNTAQELDMEDDDCIDVTSS